MKPTVDLQNDMLFKGAIGTLIFCGVLYVLLGVGFLALYGTMGVAGAGAGEAAILLVVGLVVLVVSVGCGVGNFAVAWGLMKRKKWAWIFCVIIGGLYAPSGCLPLGLLLLVAMLRSGVKESYEAECDSTLGAPTRF